MSSFTDFYVLFSDLLTFTQLVLLTYLFSLTLTCAYSLTLLSYLLGVLVLHFGFGRPCPLVANGVAACTNSEVESVTPRARAPLHAVYGLQ